MIAFTMLGTNDLQKAAGFYDALIAEMGGKRAVDLGDAILYAGPDDGPLFSITEPADGNAASVGNGTMFALAAPDSASVDRWHAKAIELGAENNGDPGARERGPLNFYAAYFRDLDGNKLNFFHLMETEEAKPAEAPKPAEAAPAPREEPTGFFAKILAMFRK